MNINGGFVRIVWDNLYVNILVVFVCFKFVVVVVSEVVIVSFMFYFFGVEI